MMKNDAERSKLRIKRNNITTILSNRMNGVLSYVDDFRWVLFVGILIRIFALVWGAVQDAYFAVRYTDIDYFVFSDAASLVWALRSPFERATFRYSPFLAALFTINEWTGTKMAGKCVLCVADVVGALLLRQCCLALKMSSREASRKVAVFFLLNPLIINVSTRGNTETLTVGLLLWSLLALFSSQWKTTGFVLGLATHIRLFPVLFGVPITLYVFQSQAREGGSTNAAKGQIWSWKAFRIWVSIAAFGALGFVVPTVAAWYLYGDQYLQEAIFYHAGRSDHRHSLSLAFPLLYMSPSIGPWLAIPQFAAALGVTGLIFYRLKNSAKQAVAFSFALQTAALVTFSRVLTVQYFAWWIPFLAFLPLETKRKDQLSLIFHAFLWAVSLAIWLLCGYTLEFLSWPRSILSVHFAGCAFFLAQCNMLRVFIRNCIRNEGS